MWQAKLTEEEKKMLIDDLSNDFAEAFAENPDMLWSFVTPVSDAAKEADRRRVANN